MEEKATSLKGIYRDILKDGNDTVIYDSGWQSNRIVDQCRTLLAAFMKNEAAQGIQKVKVGKGLDAWDDLSDGPPHPEATLTQLEDTDPYVLESGEWSLEFLDDDDQHSVEPTKRVQVTLSLGENQPPVPEGSVVTTYPLREFGLFGIYNDGTDDHDYMIDCIRHPVIHKDTTATLIRKVKLYF